MKPILLADDTISQSELESTAKWMLAAIDLQNRNSQLHSRMNLRIGLDRNMQFSLILVHRPTF